MTVGACRITRLRSHILRSKVQPWTTANCGCCFTFYSALHQKFLISELSPSTTCNSNQFSSMRGIRVIHANRCEIVKCIVDLRLIHASSPLVPHIGDIAAQSVRYGRTRSEFNGAMFITVYVVTHGSDSVNDVIETISALMRTINAY